jgi:hypothetical protein
MNGNQFNTPTHIFALGDHVLSAFRTCEDRQPTSEFVAACSCPDGLMQDETQEGG